MLVLGLVLVVIAGVALLAVLLGGANDPANFDIGVLNIDTTTMGVFLIGAATVLIFVMGLELIRSGLRRAAQRRKTNKANRVSASAQATRDDGAVHRD